MTLALHHRLADHAALPVRLRDQHQSEESADRTPVAVEHSKYERTIVAALRNTGYYDISPLSSEAEAERALAQGELLFVIDIPPNFDRSVDRGETPSVLIDADATDPTAIGNATAALAGLSGGPQPRTAAESARQSPCHRRSSSWFTPATTRSN